MAGIQARLRARETPAPRFCWKCRKSLPSRAARCPVLRRGTVKGSGSDFGSRLRSGSGCRLDPGLSPRQSVRGCFQTPVVAQCPGLLLDLELPRPAHFCTFHLPTPMADN